MPTLPAHYRKFYISFIKLACFMIIFALVAGILFQESGTRKIHYDGKFTPGVPWESLYHLALLHGHVFLIGVLVPMAMLVMAQFGLIVGGSELSAKSLKLTAALYHSGAGATVLLMLYKGYHYVMAVRGNQMDFAVIDDSFFGAQHVVRAIGSGLSHTAMGAGLSILAVSILKSMPKKDTVPAA